MSANEGGKRLAAAHLVFNVVTGFIAIIFIYQIMAFVDMTSAAVGIANDDYTMKLAVFHTVFNLLGIIVMLPLIGKLVSSLTKFIPEKKPEVDQPMYLSDASAAFPETALEAVRQEAQRVYQAALRIIGDGLGMKQADLISNIDLEQSLAAQKQVHEFDIDAMYDRHIKGIYSAIVAFISSTRFSRQEEHSSGLRWLRNACTRMVEAVKDTRNIQENLIHYKDAENQNIVDLYNRIRLQVGLVIRDLEEMRTSSEEALDFLSMDGLKLQVQRENEAINNSVTELIGQGGITPTMGSSLINDIGFANAISMNLIEAAQALFVSADHDLNQAIQDVTLTKNELARLTQTAAEPVMSKDNS